MSRSPPVAELRERVREEAAALRAEQESVLPAGLFTGARRREPGL